MLLVLCCLCWIITRLLGLFGVGLVCSVVCCGLKVDACLFVVIILVVDVLGLSLLVCWFAGLMCFAYCWLWVLGG